MKVKVLAVFNFGGQSASIGRLIGRDSMFSPLTGLSEVQEL